MLRVGQNLYGITLLGAALARANLTVSFSVTGASRAFPIPRRVQLAANPIKQEQRSSTPGTTAAGAPVGSSKYAQGGVQQSVERVESDGCSSVLGAVGS